MSGRVILPPFLQKNLIRIFPEGLNFCTRECIVWVDSICHLPHTTREGVGSSNMEAKPKKRFVCRITADECKGCERCVLACPKGVLAMGTKLNMMSFPSAIVVKEDACVGCGGCFYSCPEPGAITILEITDDTKE